ncbi:MAG: phosphotransferase enzyme family protein [Candidatus Hodarchaeota archaeon]
MKQFEELYCDQVRRLSQIAQAALKACGLTDAKIEHVEHSNDESHYAKFRVDTLNSTLTKVANELYVNNRFMLRIHKPGYQTTKSIAAQLEWLSALRHEAELPVPDPVPTLKGKLLIEVTTPDVPGRWNCSVLRWMKGQILEQGIQPSHFRSLGRLMAQIHQHAEKWHPSVGFPERQWDWEALFGDNMGLDFPRSEVWARLPQHHYKPFETVTRQVREVMDEWGKGSDVFGMIHSDLCYDGNVLFTGEEPRAIDFNDCGPGYWIYDIAVALHDLQEDKRWHVIRDVFLEGYLGIRPLPEEQLAHLDLFMAARHASAMLWANEGTCLFSNESSYQWLEHSARHVKRYVDSC